MAFRFLQTVQQNLDLPDLEYTDRVLRLDVPWKFLELIHNHRANVCPPVLLCDQLYELAVSHSLIKLFVCYFCIFHMVTLCLTFQLFTIISVLEKSIELIHSLLIYLLVWCCFSVLIYHMVTLFLTSHLLNMISIL